jgi:hypothetical protein
MDLAKWENYKGLPSDQEEDLYELFVNCMNNVGISSYEDVKNYFKTGTDTFTQFLLVLEDRTEWFDYSQMPQIFDEISLYLEQLRESDEENDW